MVASTTAGLLWIALMTWICYKGIEISARLQYLLLSIEVVVLILFAAFALFRVYSGTACRTRWYRPLTGCGPVGWSSAR